MDKTKNGFYLKEIQKRLPDNIFIVDETNFELREEEYINIHSWIKLFNIHYTEFRMNKNMPLHIVPISKRCIIDFYFYRFPNEINGKYEIYLKNPDLKYHNYSKSKPKKIIETFL